MQFEWPKPRVTGWRQLQCAPDWLVALCGFLIPSPGRSLPGDSTLMLINKGQGSATIWQVTIVGSYS